MEIRRTDGALLRTVKGETLRGVALHGADLSGANLSGANLSGAKGLLDPVDWMSRHFERDAEGVIVYKCIGDTEFPAPSHWTIEPGAVLTEVPNHDRCSTCACGANFGTREWCRSHYPDAQLWRCRIGWMDLLNVVVPYNTDGKARCGSLTLLEPVGEEA